MKAKQIFGERLLSLREQRNETQEQLAKAIGITRQSLSRYETNERTPNIDLIYRIAKHYCVSSDYLLGLSENSTVDITIQSACKATGLSEAAVNKLNYIYNHADCYTTNKVNCLYNSFDSTSRGMFVFDVIPAIDVISRIIESRFFEILIGDTQIYTAMINSEDNNKVVISEDLYNEIKTRPIAQTYSFYITPKIIADTKINHAVECVKRIIKEISENKEAESNGEHNSAEE